MRRVARAARPDPGFHTEGGWNILRGNNLSERTMVLGKTLLYSYRCAARAAVGGRFLGFTAFRVVRGVKK